MTLKYKEEKKLMLNHVKEGSNKNNVSVFGLLILNGCWHIQTDGTASSIVDTTSFQDLSQISYPFCPAFSIYSY